MRVDVITREYPPEVYGGAGVHVAELARSLRHELDVRVRCFGAPRNEANTHAYLVPGALSYTNPAMATLGVDLAIANDVDGADLVHSHTWYANAAGQLASLLHDIPHVVTAHSLEPLRPWKADQLGGGYRISQWIEKNAFESAHAVIAVSDGMRRDIARCYPEIDEARISVIHNGIDLDRWQRTIDHDAVRSFGIDPDRPSVVFVGRITRQKGLQYLLRAARLLPPDVQLILCAGAPDTPEILRDVQKAVAALQTERTGVVWIERRLAPLELSTVLSNATTFVCPSVYEPLGIVNLEAMACGVAVVGTNTGGIPEVIDDGVTGRLVDIDQVDDGTGDPRDPERFVADLAATLIDVVSDRDTALTMGAAGRARAEQMFSWDGIATRTTELYRSLL
jgi:starch synthase